jgi:tetratricopeptide (TPR) repeat protein
MNTPNPPEQAAAAPKPTRRKNTFARVALPWIVAAGALAIYLLTLNRWVSFGSLPSIARAAGWIWQPEITSPLNWLVTLPFRWLPATSIPLALNLFSAVCGALTLALLVRSVALLPHNRTEQQRIRERSVDGTLSIVSAWLPPLLAAVLCGLQLTFWEGATASSGGSNQMLDLLVFAYIIRCLLEFRASDRDSWLLKAALVYGLGATNDWCLVGFFPLFLIALIWLKGFSFFNGGFLARLSLCGMAGLLLFLLQPLVLHFSHDSHISFWQALRFNLSSEKQAVLNVTFSKISLFRTDPPRWILGLTSLLPLLVISIRWPSYFGDPSRMGTLISTSVFHVVHGALMLACAWVCLDSPFSPRRVVPGLPLLGLYYLAALSVGYFSGYFLLVFGVKPAPVRNFRPIVSGPTFFDPIIASLTWVLALAAPIVLLYQNLPQIRITNGPMLQQYATFMQEGLGTNRAIILSDDPRLLFLIRANQKPSQDYAYLDTGLLKWPDYQRYLNQQFPKRISFKIPADREKPVGDLDILFQVAALGQSNAIFYLNPSFGYYFEAFYSEPHGLVYKMCEVLTNSLLPPPPPQTLIAENEAFWKRFDDTLTTPLQKANSTELKNFRFKGAFDKLGLKKEANFNAFQLAALASRARDKWGVELQRGGQPALAASHFAKAQDLNPENPAAQINEEFNLSLQKGEKSAVALAKSIEDQFLRYRDWNQMLLANGPIDEPSLCFRLAQTLMQGNLFRQAGGEMARVKSLSPESYPTRLLLAFLYLRNQMSDAALKEIAEIHAMSSQFNLNSTNHLDLMGLEAAAYLQRQEPDKAREVVNRQLKAFPGDERFLASGVQTFMNFGSYSNALPLIEVQLKDNPTNTGVLINQGFAHLQMKDYQRALPPLCRAMELDTNNYIARFNRALAYLGANQLDAAQRDYETVQKAYPTFYQGYYGLQEVAFRKKDTNSVIRNCQLYLSHAPTNTEEAKEVLARLDSMKNPGSSTNHPAPAPKPKS